MASHAITSTVRAMDVLDIFFNERFRPEGNQADGIMSAAQSILPGNSKSLFV